LLLRRQGKTQEEVARMVGVEQATISKWGSNDDVNNIPWNNAYISNTYAPPDLRVSIPKKE